MPKFRENRANLLLAHYDGLINDEAFVFLYDINTAKSADLPYYDPFILDNMSDDECKTEFRFLRNDIYRLKNAMDHVYGHWNHLLSTFSQLWLSPDNLEIFANAIFQKSGALENCFGFVDGTVRPVSRPGRNQRVLYNGHKKVHALKFQSVPVPNDLVASLYGPVEGKRHDSPMLAMSGLYNQLLQHAVLPNGNSLCIYGDPAYPHRPHLQGPFKGARITQDQRDWNKAMSRMDFWGHL